MHFPVLYFIFEIFDPNVTKVTIFGPGNGFPMATNVVLLLFGVLVIRLSIPKAPSWGSTDRMKLFTHINVNILHQATVADFLFRP